MADHSGRDRAGARRRRSAPVMRRWARFGMRRYVRKMRGGPERMTMATRSGILWSSLGGAVGIAVVAWLATSTGQPWIMASLGATSVIVFGYPDSSFAQPRAVVGGHVLSAVVGVVLYQLIGDAWWAMAVGVGTATLAMHVTRTVHPPAGSDPLLIMLGGGACWPFVLKPVAVGAVTLVICAVVFNNFGPYRRYPRHWR